MMRGEQMTLEWHRLTKRTMPPMGTLFLLWMGMRDTDGGFPAVARRVTLGNESYIRFRSADEFWRRLEEREYRSCRWALVARPED